MMVGGRDLQNSYSCLHVGVTGRDIIPLYQITGSITGASADNPADEVLVTENSLTPQCPALKLDQWGRFVISIYS